MKIKNTAESPNPEWLFGGNPNAIERQEEDGQKQLVESSQLPRKAGYHEDSKNLLEKLGCKIIGESDGDDLFYDVELPKGWKKQSTDHPMWSELINEKNDVVAQIFYKAAFYDRDAFIRLV